MTAGSFSTMSWGAPSTNTKNGPHWYTGPVGQVEVKLPGESLLAGLAAIRCWKRAHKKVTCSPKTSPPVMLGQGSRIGATDLSPRIVPPIKSGLREVRERLLALLERGTVDDWREVLTALSVELRV